VELVQLKVDVIVTEGPQGVRAAQNATRSIPIVMGDVGDAVNQGFVASLARPGGNVTGLSSLNAELSGKRLELLKEAVPKLSRFAVLREAVGDAYPLRTIESAAQAMGLKAIVFQVREADEVPSAFAAMTSSKVGAFQLLTGSLFVSRLHSITELATQTKLPGIFSDARFVRSGGLISYGPDVLALYKRAAIFVDKIFKGAKPSDLAVEQPTAFELTINLKTANALGIKIPPGLLSRADQILK